MRARVVAGHDGWSGVLAARATARGRRPKPRPGRARGRGAAGFRPARSIRRVPIGPPTMPPETMPTIAEATASDAAPVTPAASKSGANARPVAGPPVSVTEPASTPSSGGTPSAAATAAPTRFCEHGHSARERQEQGDGRAALAQQRHARAEADRGEERDHQRRLQRRVEADGLVAGRAKSRDRDRDEQPADDGRRDVVAGQQPTRGAGGVAGEQHEPRRGQRLHEVELDQ